MQKKRAPGARIWSTAAGAPFVVIVVLLVLLALGMVACGDDGGTTSSSAEGTATTAGGSGDTSGAGAASSETSVPAPPAGDQLFATLCAGCHGNDGKSGFSPSLVGAEEADVREAITQGTGDMPAFGDKLSTEEIDAVVVYVGSLQ